MGIGFPIFFITTKTKTMNTHKLKEVLAIQTYSFEQWRMFSYIIRECKANNYEYFVHKGNIYVSKGNAIKTPCIVSHMDSVHKIKADLHPSEIDGNITGIDRTTMKQTGIGGDDKVGIFIALECLSKLDNIKAVFFRDEEVGCLGSNEAYMHFFNDCTFVLQCDRKGNTDFITNASGTELSSKAFRKAIKPIVSNYGYSFANGMMTDVMTLKENGLKVSCANISCGYYNPHTDYEFVNINDVENCLNLVLALFMLINDEYPHTRQEKAIISYKYPYAKKYYNSYGWGGYDDFVDSYQPTIYNEEKQMKTCLDCWVETETLSKEGYCNACHNWHCGKQDILF
jgi:hypothetical protein